MPPQQGSLTGQQLATKSYLVFSDFETMDTHVARVACPPNRLPWCENLQLVGPNQLALVPGVAPALATIAGKTASKMWYAFLTIAGTATDYEIIFETDGSLQAVNLAGGAVTQIAAPGTFSNPDVTVWQANTLLIADPTAGYSAWNGTVLSKSGTVSPFIVVTNGGSGYAGGATAVISGGTGSGATATVTTVGGVVTALTLTNTGTGFLPTDTLTVTISPVAGGTGATATAIVWPQLPGLKPTTLAVFAGRVWLGAGRTLQFTGTKGADDVNPADAAGTATIVDADLVHSIVALRNLNNFLWIFGDNSIKQIGTVSVTGSTTVFTTVTLSSDTGTTFPQTIQSYNRLVLFANKAGIWAVLGSSVQKISEEMDGVFPYIDFTLPPCAALNDIRNIRCYLLLVRYNDPAQNRARTLLLVFQNKKWFVCSMGDGLLAMATAVLAGSLHTFGSSGADVTEILAPTSSALVSFILQTALSHHGKPHMGKKTLRAAISQIISGVGTVGLRIDSETLGGIQGDPEPYPAASVIIWLNINNQVVNWLNGSSQTVTFGSAGFLFQRTKAFNTGIYLGVSLFATLPGYNFNNAILEYQETTALASRVQI